MCTFFLVVAFRDARFLSGLYGRFSYIVLQRAPGLAHSHRDARSDHGYLTTDACEWPQCGCLSTVRRASHHVVV